MARPAASLANLIPWNSQTAREAGLKGVQVRAQRTLKTYSTPDLQNPELSPVTRVNLFLAQTDNPDRMAKLAKVRRELLSQERMVSGQRSEPETPPQPPAKPLRFLPKP